MFKTV